MCDFFIRAEKGHCFIEVVTITGCDDINNVQKIIKRWRLYDLPRYDREEVDGFLMDQRIEHTYTPARANINTHTHTPFCCYIDRLSEYRNGSLTLMSSTIGVELLKWRGSETHTSFYTFHDEYYMNACTERTVQWYTGTNTENDQNLPTCKKHLTNLVKTEKQLVRKWQQIFLKNWFSLTFRLNKSKFQFVRSKFVCVCTSRNVALVKKICSWMHIGMKEDLQFSENRLKRSDWTRRYLKDEKKKG